MEFLLLGHLMVRRDGDLVAIPRGKQRTVLAALLLQANRVVTIDDLARVLWDGGRPPSAQVTIQNYVKRLRQALGDADRSRISTWRRGYEIRVEDGELDLSRFQELLAAAQTAARNGSWEAAATTAAAALALWRGNPLGGVESEALLRRAAPRLTQMRLQAQETRIDAGLRLGRHAELIEELRQLTDAHPLREHLWALRMLALYRSGRQGDALAAYQRARTNLVAELGAEPGTELRAAHREVLTGHDDTGQLPVSREAPRTADAASAPQAGAPVPRQLPAPVPHFTGRGAELATLNGLLGEPVQAPGPVLISAIDGTAGVGKTALAVHWAHQMASRFPDGQLYVNLRGYDPGPPVRAGDALAGFLRALGVPGQEVPVDDEERAARYRGLLAGRRALVVLDNASDVEQIRPLLPASAGCVVLVTSRDSLTGLVARDGARRLDLDLLPSADAADLLRALIGDRVDDDRAGAQAIAEQCCRLPLALRVAAELAADRPEEPLADLAGELADQQRRLDLLAADGDQRTALRAVFSWSYQHLDAAAARGFRLLGLHPGPDFEPYAVAALTGGTVAQAQALLDRLARAHLVQPSANGTMVRMVMHDLLRAYATELASTHDSDDQRRAAVTRLLGHYLHAASAAMDTLYPAQRHRLPRVPVPDTPVPPVGEPAPARAWLDAELPALVAAGAYAARHGRPEHAIQLSAAIFWHLDVSGHYAEAVTVHRHALDAARQAGDRAAEANALYSLGAAGMRQGASQSAAGYLQQALALYRLVGDVARESSTLACLGNVEARAGRYDEAAGHLRQALALSAGSEGRRNPSTLICLGLIDLRQGRDQQAVRRFQQAAAVSRELDDPVGESAALDNLGCAELRHGDYPAARAHLEQSLALARKVGYRLGEAFTLTSMGLLHLRQRGYQQAASYFEQALAVSRQAGERNATAEMLNHLGDLMLETGRPDAAVDRHRAALDLAVEIRDPYEQARGQAGLARAHELLGRPGQARQHWGEALRLYTELGAPEAGQIRERLRGSAVSSPRS